MAFVGNAGGTEAVFEALAHVGARLEAGRVDVRPHVHVVAVRRILPQLGGIGPRERADGLRGHAVLHAAPSGVRHRESARRRHGDHGDAVGEAQQRRDPGNGGDKSVGARACRFACGTERLGRRIFELHHDFPVHLAGHHERNVGRIERFQHEHSVALNRRRVVAHVITQVERGIRAFAHPARASGERDAHARALVQGIVGKRRKTTRAESARGYLRDGQLSGRDHQATAPYRWRFRKSGM